MELGRRDSTQEIEGFGWKSIRSPPTISFPLDVPEPRGGAQRTATFEKKLLPAYQPIAVAVDLLPVQQQGLGGREDVDVVPGSPLAEAGLVVGRMLGS